MKVSIVGPIKQSGKEGKTNPKIFIYQKAFELLGHQVMLFSTNVSKYNVISLFTNLKNSLAFGDTVVLMFGGNACRKLLPLILFLNKKYKKRLILAPFGTGPINPLLSKATTEFAKNFIENCEFGNLKDKKQIITSLSRMDCVLVQTETLKRCFEKFYNLDNIKILPNFRLNESSDKESTFFVPKCDLSLVFVSRVCEEKGILDLVRIVDEINSEHCHRIVLGIYGADHLSNEEKREFDELLLKSDGLIEYHGSIENRYVQNTIKQYDFSCLPTKHNGEGAPGFIVESLVVGVPVITSSFSQSKDLIENNKNGYIFEINNTQSLKRTLLFALANKSSLAYLRKNAKSKGKEFIFENNKDLINEILIG